MGRAKGNAKVIYNKSELDKVEEGNIIISPMTTPDMMNAILKACAIVTDEDGLLCHTAIISRELNIPCIIGTKIAFRIVKDNDFIEVDTTRVKGIVKLLH